jgi:diacylglycerol kinase family enzyme
MARHIIVINNPAARQGRSQGVFSGVDIVKRRFDCSIVDVHEASGYLRRSAADAKRTAALVFGGDGTVHRLLPDLLASRIPFTVFPAGTVNDFALQSGLTADWEALAGLIEGDCRRTVDLVTVNGKPILTYSSIGLGAHTSALGARTRSVMTPLRQVAPTLVAPLNTAATIFCGRGYRRRLRFENAEKTREMVTPGLYVTNLPRLNRTIKLTETPGSPCRGFGAYVLASCGRIDLLKTVFTLQKHKDIAAISDRLTVFSGPWLTISSTDTLPFQVYGDGEFLMRTNAAHYSILHDALEIFA